MTVCACVDEFDGRLLQDFCRDCHHVLGVHREDLVCTVCDAVSGVNVMLDDLYHEVQQFKERLISDAPQ